jgi:hypothetical protein
MSERKVLTKYFPPDFDPSAIARPRGNKNKQAGPKVQTVRLMAPFSMRCTACGEYVYKGRKFNARKETPEGERYLGIQIYRFYIRCTRCSAEITFRTDPKNQDYAVERGAKRNTEPWKRGLDNSQADETDEQRLVRLEREMAEAEGEDVGAERNAMMELEAKTEEARREMAVADALDEIRSRNARIERAKRDGVEVEVPVPPEDEEKLRQEREDEEAAKRAFAFAREHAQLEEVMEDVDAEDGEDGTSTPSSIPRSASSAAMSTITTAIPKPAATAPTPMAPPPPSFKRQVKKKKDLSAALGIKKKIV